MLFFIDRDFFEQICSSCSSLRNAEYFYVSLFPVIFMYLCKKKEQAPLSIIAIIGRNQTFRTYLFDKRMINKWYGSRNSGRKKRSSNVCCIQSMQAIFKFKLQLDFSNRTKLTVKSGVVDMLVSNTWLEKKPKKKKSNKQASINRVHLQSFKNRDPKLMIYQMLFQSGNNFVFFVIREWFWPRQRPTTNRI